MFEKPQKAQVVRIKIEAISLDSTSIAPSLDGPLLAGSRGSPWLPLAAAGKPSSCCEGRLTGAVANSHYRPTPDRRYCRGRAQPARLYGCPLVSRARAQSALATRRSRIQACPGPNANKLRASRGCVPPLCSRQGRRDASRSIVPSPRSTAPHIRPTRRRCWSTSTAPGNPLRAHTPHYRRGSSSRLRWRLGIVPVPKRAAQHARGRFLVVQLQQPIQPLPQNDRARANIQPTAMRPSDDGSLQFSRQLSDERNGRTGSFAHWRIFESGRSVAILLASAVGVRRCHLFLIFTTNSANGRSQSIPVTRSENRRCRQRVDSATSIP
jgi:hypothetical protein